LPKCNILASVWDSLTATEASRGATGGRKMEHSLDLVDISPDRSVSIDDSASYQTPDSESEANRSARVVVLIILRVF
jgi:hypothetical protein